MPIGIMDADETQSLAEKFSQSSSEDKYCTWFLHDTNPEASLRFHHAPLPPPASPFAFPIKGMYLRALDGAFSDSQESFLLCAEKRNFISMGCNVMQHRGPTAFAMFLSFAGCTSSHATQIANQIWGLNWVVARGGLAQSAYELGNARPELRERLQRVMNR